MYRIPVIVIFYDIINVLSNVVKAVLYVFYFLELYQLCLELYTVVISTKNRKCLCDR